MPKAVSFCEIAATAAMVKQSGAVCFGAVILTHQLSSPLTAMVNTRLSGSRKPYRSLPKEPTLYSPIAFSRVKAYQTPSVFQITWLGTA